MFKKTDTVGPFGEAERGVYLVAGSFEPRCVRTTSLLSRGAFAGSVIFNYEDTLDSAMGRHHVERLKAVLEEKTGRPPYVLRCSFADPYSVVRSFGALLSTEQWFGQDPVFTLDATCFTKIHLLLLLKYIAERYGYGSGPVRVCYTEPLTYATAFGRHLSRPAVVIRKVCGGNRTRRGADTQQVLASVVRTARQRHLDPRPLITTMLCAPEPVVPEALALPPPS